MSRTRTLPSPQPPKGPSLRDRLEWPTTRSHQPDIPLGPWAANWERLSPHQRKARVTMLAKSLSQILAEDEPHLDAIYETMRQQVLARLRSINPRRSTAERRQARQALRQRTKQPA